jgi:hypothetical protein
VKLFVGTIYRTKSPTKPGSTSRRLSLVTIKLFTTSFTVFLKHNISIITPVRKMVYVQSI